VSPSDTGDTTALSKFVEWFRTDLVYKAPEEWPGNVAWFLDEVVRRFGSTAPETSEVEQLRQELTRAQALSSGDPAAVADLRAENEQLRAALAAAAPAPPVDVAARLRAVAKIVEDSAPGLFAEGMLRRLARWVEQNPDDTDAQAIARALTGEATGA
jgi:hypothetical protein